MILVRVQEQSQSSVAFLDFAKACRLIYLENGVVVVGDRNRSHNGDCEDNRVMVE
jgi:hypothetical protein